MTVLFRKIILVVFLTSTIAVLSGCGRLLDNAASDIGGWDVSACVDGFGTCFELFRDNSDKFADGFEEALGGL